MDGNDKEDDGHSRKRFQMNTATPQFAEAKDATVRPADISPLEHTEEAEYKMEIDEAIPDALPMRYLSTKRYSTTSSVYASETIGSPDVNQILFCLGTVLQAQIVEDGEFPPEIKALFPEFDLIPDLKPELGGVLERNPEYMIERDAYDDEELRYKLENNIVPTVDTITRYISYLAMCLKLTPEINIIALVYVNRLASKCQLVLTMANWRAVWLTSIILAQKMWNDRPVKTGSVAKFLPRFDKAALRGLEARALQLLEFSVGVKPSLYVKYYFELRQLFTTIMGFELSEWSVKPLTVRNAARLDALCARTSSKIMSGMSPSNTDGSSMDLSQMENFSPGAKDVKAKKSDKKGMSSSLEDVTYTSQARFVLS